MLRVQSYNSVQASLIYRINLSFYAEDVIKTKIALIELYDMKSFKIDGLLAPHSIKKEEDTVDAP